MQGRKVAVIAILSALVASAVLVFGTPTARAAIGPKTITVDGNPSDWTGTAPLVPDTSFEDLVANEWIWLDATGDDTGDGDYTYPKAGDLNVTGLFDIREVRFTADANNLYVLIRIGDLNNPWGGSDGFSTVALVLLIDVAAGGQTAARPNVDVAAVSGWEYWAKIAQTGWHGENAKVFDASGNWAPITNKGDAALDAIEASIPLAFIGKDGHDPNGATWKFMLGIGGFAGENPNGFRGVKAARWCCDWEFGGGDDGANDPEVIDIAFSTAQTAELAWDGGPATLTSQASVAFGTLGFTPDTTAPTISGITETLSFNSAKIDWTTDEIATTTVRWGTSAGSLTNTISIDQFVTAHSVTITSLNPTTQYFYQIEGKDIAGNVATGTVRSFTTSAAPPSNIAAFVGDTFTWNDSIGDDVGDGNYAYPTNTADVDWFGRADLTWLNMSRTATALHINAKLNANPETEWRQRMGTIAIFIDQDNRYGSGARAVGLVGTGAELTDPHPMNLSVHERFGWEYLVVANFQNRSAVGDPSGVGEMFVFNNTWNAAQNRWSLIYLSTAPSLSPEPDTGQIFAKDGNEVDIWLNFTVLGNTDGWTFVVAVMLFDDAARPFDQGGVRQVRETAAAWVGGGSNGPGNPNVYDLAFYSNTAAQTADLSDYGADHWANLTYGMWVNFGTMQFQQIHAVPLTHTYAVTVTRSVAELNETEDATITVTFTDNAAPVNGATVSLGFQPNAAGSIVGNQIKTTGANGQVTFTFRAASVTDDTTVTFTATATNGTAAPQTGTGTLVVKAPTPPTPPAGLSPVLIAGIVILVIIIIAAIALLMRRKKPAGPGGGGAGGGGP